MKRGQNGQSLTETSITFPVIIIMILAVFQFTILITCQLGVNFAAYQASRAILLSSNKSKKYGYGNANSILKDAKNTVNGTLFIFQKLGWLIPGMRFGFVRLYRHNGKDKYGIGTEIDDSTSGPAKNLGHPPNRTIWVVVEGRVRIIIPLMKKIFGLFGLNSVKATCLVDTPSQP